MYGKVFESIYDGTLYGHWEAIVTMQQMIVLAGPDGVVDMTPQAIAARTSIPLEIIRTGLKVLGEPDPYTRTPGEEGRRIILIDSHRPWGWKLVNHGKYMRLRNMEQKREADRARMSEKRSQINDVAIESQSVADVAHKDTDKDSNKEQSAQRSRGSRLPPDWEPSEILKAWAVKERPDLNVDRVVSCFRDHWSAMPGTRGLKLDWEATFRNWVRGEKVNKSGAPDRPTAIQQTWCAYCERRSIGNVNGIEHCGQHTDNAMSSEKPPKVKLA